MHFLARVLKIGRVLSEKRASAYLMKQCSAKCASTDGASEKILSDVIAHSVKKRFFEATGLRKVREACARIVCKSLERSLSEAKVLGHASRSGFKLDSREHRMHQWEISTHLWCKFHDKCLSKHKPFAKNALSKQCFRVLPNDIRTSACLSARPQTQYGTDVVRAPKAQARGFRSIWSELYEKHLSAASFFAKVLQECNAFRFFKMTLGRKDALGLLPNLVWVQSGLMRAPKVRARNFRAIWREFDEKCLPLKLFSLSGAKQAVFYQNPPEWRSHESVFLHAPPNTV